MKKNLFLSVLILMNVSLLANDNSEGVYFGLGYGSVKYSDSNYVNEIITPAELSTSDSGVKVYGGYQFNNVVALELGYADLGTFNAGGYSQTSTSVSAGVNLGYSFLESQLRPYVLLSLAMLNTQFENNPYNDLNGDNTIIQYGVGIQYEPNFLDGFGVRLAYELNPYSLSALGHSGSTTIQKDYSQSLNQLYVAFQYKF